MSDRRRVWRKIVSGELKIHWSDEIGNYFYISGSWCDLAEFGGALQLKRPVKPGTTVKIESSWLRQSGQAVVKYCEAAGPFYRLGLEFVGGTVGQPVEGPAAQPGGVGRVAEACLYCRFLFLPGLGRCPRCGKARPGNLACRLCKVSGHAQVVNACAVNGFEPGTDRSRTWPVHQSCLDSLRGEVRASFSVLRCPVCCGDVDLGLNHNGHPPQPKRCPRCGIPPAAIEAGWRKRDHPCVICSLPIYEIIHAVWAGACEAARSTSDTLFLHDVHRFCALRLGVKG